VLIQNAAAAAAKGRRVVVITQVRVCRIGACSMAIPVTLARQGVCLAHYLDEVFTRISAVQERCRQNELPDSRTLSWLREQGDLAVTLLSGEGPESSEDRARLLELLLCLANLHESMRRPQTT
jgi:hypothetical protein